MERKEEILVLLKELLGQADKVINKNQYCDTKNSNVILKSCYDLNNISKQINTYLEEIKPLLEV